MSNTVQATPVWKPAAPSGLTAAVAPAAGVGSGQVKLSWTAPTDNGGAAVSDYRIERSTDGATWTAVADGVSTATTFTVSGLTNGTNAQVPGRARQHRGHRTVEQHGPGHTRVDAGRSRRVGRGDGTSRWGGFGPGEADLDRSRDDGGSAITDYRIDHPSTAPRGQPWTTGCRRRPSFTVAGLTNGTQYSFRVSARNSLGDGPFSTTSRPRRRGSRPLPAG